MNAPLDATQRAALDAALARVSLNDKYTLERGRAYMSGTQALVRLPMLQQARDAAAGLNTAGFISGYRGSPLGGLDQALWKAKAHLDAHRIVFQPGVNEDLAATAIWGTQQVNLYPGAKYDGVFSMWYGKGPGVDRCGDVFKHANSAGSSRHGGVLVLAGDDHAAKSSTLAHQSEHILKACGLPVLFPSNVQEYLDFGLHGWAMSRYSGLWVAMKCVTEVVESSASVVLDPLRTRIVLPDDFALPGGTSGTIGANGAAGGLNIRWPDPPLVQEARLLDYKWYAALAYVRANRLDHIEIDSPHARFGIVTAGKAYLDVRQALADLGLDDATCQRIGVRLYKVGCVWPLEAQGAQAFARGLQEILVVEEKRQILEYAIKEELYNWPDGARPRVFGKFDEKDGAGGEWSVPQGNWLLPAHYELSPALIARAIATRLDKFALPADVRARIAARLAVIDAKEKALARPRVQTERQPWFCSGCPHNTSTCVPEGSRAMAGIGCHYMAVWMDRSTSTASQMGGEGAAWIGQAPFTRETHVFANLGDGTYFHSGLLAIRAAIASKANITYKILYNDAVAMTGGQPVDGTLSVPQITLQLAAEGAAKIVIVTDEPRKYEGAARRQLAAGVAIHHRDRLDAVQRMLREVPGTTILIYDQTCATEKRRRRKRGAYPDPARRVFINEAVCEGCGDCSAQSNCLSVEPLDTPFGTKRQINQSACNKDFSCLKGFCPSFVTIEGGQLRKPKAVGAASLLAREHAGSVDDTHDAKAHALAARGRAGSVGLLDARSDALRAARGRADSADGAGSVDNANGATRIVSAGDTSSTNGTDSADGAANANSPARTSHADGAGGTGDALPSPSSAAARSNGNTGDAHAVPPFMPLPEPAMPIIARPYGVLVTGVGGTGVVTIGALLGMAAHLENKGVTVLDIAGLAQKGGAVLSHVQIARAPDDIHATRIAMGEADLVIGCDAIVTASDECLSRMQTDRTRVVLNIAPTPTAAFIHNPNWRFPGANAEQDVRAAAGANAGHTHHVAPVDATRYALALLGDAIYTNPFVLGYAWQRGWLPLAHASLRRAIELNDMQIGKNLAAFEWGRRAAHDPAMIERIVQAAQTGASSADTTSAAASAADAGKVAGSASTANAGMTAGSANTANAGTATDSTNAANTGKVAGSANTANTETVADSVNAADAGTATNSANTANAGTATDSVSAADARTAAGPANATNAGTATNSANTADAGTAADSVSAADAGTAAGSASTANAGTATNSVSAVNAGKVAGSASTTNTGTAADSTNAANAENATASASAANASDPANAAGKTSAANPATALAALIDTRARHLRAYQDNTYAACYLAVVETVRAAETSLVKQAATHADAAQKTAAKRVAAHADRDDPPNHADIQPSSPLSLPLTEAVAQNLHRLMAYKDEYEVARLFADPAFIEKVNARFEGDWKLNFHLAPPMFARKDDAGRPQKKRYGAHTLSALRVLARLKFLRGTAFDPFGRTAERRAERALIVEYEALVRELLGGLRADNHAQAIELASLPDAIRGYGHVKARNLAAVRTKWDALLAKWRAAQEKQEEVTPRAATA